MVSGCLRTRPEARFMVDTSISGGGEDDMSRKRPGMDRVVVFFGSRRVVAFRRIKREVVNAQFHEVRGGMNLIDVECGDHA
jgi:hypothetical protein